MPARPPIRATVPIKGMYIFHARDLDFRSKGIGRAIIVSVKARRTNEGSMNRIVGRWQMD